MCECSSSKPSFRLEGLIFSLVVALIWAVENDTTSKAHVCMQEFSGFTKTLLAGDKVTGTARNFIRNAAYSWIWALGYFVSHSTTPFKIIIWLDFWPVPHDKSCINSTLQKGVRKLAFSQPDNKPRPQLRKCYDSVKFIHTAARQKFAHVTQKYCVWSQMPNWALFAENCITTMSW